MVVSDIPPTPLRDDDDDDDDDDDEEADRQRERERRKRGKKLKAPKQVRPHSQTGARPTIQHGVFKRTCKDGHRKILLIVQPYGFVNLTNSSMQN